MLWTWDPDKDAINRRKHGISFETAILALDDQLSIAGDDPYPYELRLQTTGMAHNVLLVVVHTQPEYDPLFDTEVGRIISARPATAHERRIHEES